jgi:UDPglucose 6-dehydrogenase
LVDIVRIARDGSRKFSFTNEPASSSGDDASETSTTSSECESQCEVGHQAQVTVDARQPNLFFSTEVGRCISEADVVLIAVNTPTKMRGAGAGSATDMAAFEAVTAEVALHARPGAIIVEKSTVPCRTAMLVQETMSLHRPNVHFEILSNPEFLAAGTAVKDLLMPDRVLIGSSDTESGQRAAAALANVYAAWVPRPRIITTNVFSSELAKLVANSMLAQRISSINSVAAICEKTGADVDEVAASMGLDPRIGNKFLKAGIGFGGSCFKKDVLSLVYLAESLGLPEVGEYWRQVVTMNEYARDRFTSRVVRCLNNTLVGKKVVVLGYAFKKNTSDTRESPALDIIRTLVDEAPREVSVFDPCCNPDVIKAEIGNLLKDMREGGVLKENGGPVQVYNNAYDACNGAYAVLITTEFDEFRSTSTSAVQVTPEGAAPSALSTPVQKPAARSKKTGPQDPRPFERVDPTHSELLSLHKYLVNSAPSTGMHSASAEDPLQRLHAEPDCADDCPDCKLEQETGTTTAGHGAGEDYRPKDRLDWAKIAYHMRKPRWVFDGRGVVDPKEMVKLGFRVESVGRVGRS